jgi:hypothetical protein
MPDPYIRGSCLASGAVNLENMPSARGVCFAKHVISSNRAGNEKYVDRKTCSVKNN